jgi:hypothetical protein
MDAHHEMNRRSTSVKRTIILALGVILALGMAIPMAAAQTTLPPKQDLGELGAEWWQWAYHKPQNVSPVLGSYEGGAQCAGGGAGKVWFLAGSFTGEDVTRTCHVPANKWIFFPVVNAECSTVEGNPPPGATLEDCATLFLDFVLEGSSMFATVDGQDVLGDISDNRAASGVFTFTLPKNNVDFFCLDEEGQPVLQCPPGPTEAASDGIWVLLEPLPRGTHTIEFGGDFPNAGFTQDNTYILTVGGKPTE